MLIREKVRKLNNKKVVILLFLSFYVCDKAKLTNCSAHGIRKRLATDMKQSGATDNELKAMFNWQNDAQIKVYTATINNKKMAQQAIDKLNNERKKVKSV